MKIKTKGLETLGTGPWRQPSEASDFTQQQKCFFQRKPKIENRQKSDGPLQWFNSSLFGGEYSVVGPSLRVPGAEAPGLISFTSKIVPRLGCTSAATANSRLHQRAEVSQSKTAISSHRSAGQLCAALCLG